ncbi:MAG: hypothetical protein AAGA58_11135 [Verrucomicrobiota bacterium]
MKKLLVFLSVILPIALLPASGQNVDPEVTVATLGDVPIHAEEFFFHIRDHVAMVAVHFKKEHSVDLSGKDWLKEYNGEVPLMRLQERALESCRTAKAIQLLAVEHEVGEKLPFPGFAKICAEINRARAKGKAEGRVLYGPVEFSPSQLYKYKITNMRNHLRDRDLQRSHQEREEALKAAIEKRVNAMPLVLRTEALHKLLVESVGAE